MIKYNNLDVKYTIQWPFNHFSLDESKFITEEEAKKKFEEKEYFQAVYFQDSHRVFCIDFEINFVIVIIYKDGGPYYEYVYRLLTNNYKRLSLRSLRIKNIDYKLNEDGFAYISERIDSSPKGIKTYKKKYNSNLLDEVTLDFGKYNNLLEMSEKMDITKFLV